MQQQVGSHRAGQCFPLEDTYPNMLKPHLVPVDELVDEGGDVLRAPILDVQVVGVLQGGPDTVLS